MNQWQVYKNKRVVITGGAGFIGSHLAETLLEIGAKVCIIDDLSTGSIENIQSILHDINFLHGSITDFELCLKATYQREIVFHLAAQASVPESFDNPHHCYQTNVTGTQNILEAGRRQGIERLIFASSCAVYGNQATSLSEESPCNPASPYGSSKLLGEQLCKDYTRYFNLETVCLRYFNVFGPRQKATGAYASAVANFKKKMAHNEPLLVFGNGLQERDFVPVQQIVEANLAAGIIARDNVSGQTFNVATGKSISLLELIEQLREEFPQYNAPIAHLPARPGDVQSVHADISKYQTYLV